MRRQRAGWIQVAVTVIGLSFTLPVHAHNDHMLVGRTSDGRLSWHPNAGISTQPGKTTILNLIPPGGPIEGFSAAVPGFSMVATPVPELDIYPPAAGADIWVRFTRIDAPLLVIETPSYLIVNDRTPPEMRVGSGSQAHAHPLWLLDTSDPEYDPSRCFWEATFVLEDKGSTHYQPSVPITFRFVAGAIPCLADLDCDGDVDLDDFTLFLPCASGPSVPYDAANPPPGCLLVPDHEGFIRADFDRDGDVDQDDFGRFQRCFGGEGRAPVAACNE